MRMPMRTDAGTERKGEEARGPGISRVFHRQHAADHFGHSIRRAANDIAVLPPDFFAYFQENPEEIPDGVHPYRIGYESMAHLWVTASTHMVR
jgi:hypothetical protein